uniref:Putative GCN5-related N-acetyltransferase n=1 Tax=uncultured bacterium 1114 TaxID=548901 RepID=B8R963_9BACT|nr:putative GCN5-related N-acetyltransferase [uncultured bacterium 1114]
MFPRLFLLNVAMMTDPIVLRPLDHKRVRQAYPLVQAVLPDTPLVRWTAFAHAYVGSSKASGVRGLMAAENEPGYILALFTYQTRDELTLGRTLKVGDLLVADFAGRDKTVGYLIDGIETMAHLGGCHAIAVDLDVAFSGGSPTCGWSLPLFERQGFLALNASQCRKIVQVSRPRLAPDLTDRMPHG